MLRTITTPVTNQFTITLPMDLVNKKIEVIAFPIEDEKEEIKNKVRPGYGCMKGKMEMNEDFNAPLDCFDGYI